LNAPGPQLTSTDTIDQLNALATELAAHGWTADVRTKRGRPPCLHTRNPEPGAGALAEDIYARPGDNGQGAYWWPWDQRIADAPASAAAAIIRTLRSASTP
jgi:hypothetical protein